MTLRAAVWRSTTGDHWFAEWCSDKDYRPGEPLYLRILFERVGIKLFPTFAEAIEYAHQITHREQG